MSMASEKIIDYQGYEWHQPMSGGKAGSGHNKTSSIQVRDGQMVVKNVRYKMGDKDSLLKAMDKVKAWCDKNPIK